MVGIILAFVLLLEVGAVRASEGVGLLAQRGGGARGHGVSARGAAQPQADVRSLLRGRVTEVDGTTGRVGVDVNGTVLDARYPPASVAELKVGDVVFVDLTIINVSRASIPGAITALDSQKGTITVKTPQGALTVPSAAQALDRVKAGDEVIRRLSLVDIGPPFTP